MSLGAFKFNRQDVAYFDSRLSFDCHAASSLFVLIKSNFSQTLHNFFVLLLAGLFVRFFLFPRNPSEKAEKRYWEQEVKALLFVDNRYGHEQVENKK